MSVEYSEEDRRTDEATVRANPEYFAAAMGRARFKWLAESGERFAGIPGLRGVWATGATTEKAKAELREVLEDWVAIGVRRGRDIPPASGHEIKIPE